MAHSSSTRITIERETALRLYRTMVRIRAFETRVERLFLDGKLPGFVHLSIGEEAIPAGVCAHLTTNDYITSTHRGHGHTLAKGADVKRMMAEIYGKKTGVCKGKGGSMHIADFSVGMLGANGVVGGGLNIAVGAGLSIRLQNRQDVAVCFFGDGASNRGVFHEAMNLASAWRLPVIFACENNAYGSTTPFGYENDKTDPTGKNAPLPVHSIDNISQRANGYAIPGLIVDGNDVLAVYDAAGKAIQRARQGGGPTLLEFKTYRLKGHFIGDPEKYRSKSEVDEWWAREPIGRFRRTLLTAKMASENELDEIVQAAEAEIEAAVQFAEESPFPDPAEAFEDLYV